MSQRKRIIENIGSLFLLQGANYLLPLITMPYLVRVLGAEKYGLLAVAAAFCQYLVVITDYGFNYTATRRIAIHREDPALVQKIFSTVMLIKTALMLISFLILVVAVLTIPTFRAEWPVYFITFLSVLGSVLFPNWLYQGMERMKYITALNIFAKVISTAAIFIFIKNQSDYLVAAFLQSLNMLVPGVLSVLLVRRMFDIRFTPSVKLADIKLEIHEGGKVFSSTLSGNVYGQGAIIIVGLMAGKASAGYYAIAQKVAGAVAGLAQPFAQALYPFLCKLFHENWPKYVKFKRNAISIGVIIFIFIGLMILFCAASIATLLSGSANNELVSLIRIYSVVVILTMMNVMLNTFILSMQKFNEMQKMYLYIAALFLLVSIPACFLYGSYGMAFSIMFVETFIMICSFRITKIEFCLEAPVHA